MSSSTALAAAAGLSLALALLHLAAPRIRRLPLVPERFTASFAGGIAVAYVFLHLLPDLADGNQAIGDRLRDVVRITPLLDLTIFFVALVGFTTFYGLERLARRRAPGEASAPGIFRLHLGSFLVYNALITYTMPLRLRTGVAFAVLFSIAMGLHFVLNDRGLEEHYGDRFNGRSRGLLAGALIFGWVAAAVAAPTNTVVVSVLTALLGGSILLNVFKDELPSGRQTSFAWFADRPRPLQRPTGPRHRHLRVVDPRCRGSRDDPACLGNEGP